MFFLELSNFAIVTLYTAVHILMEGIQKHVDLDDIINTMENIQGISSIHDLHVWSIISGQNALSCHAVVDGDLSGS